jgi:Fic family protein
MHLGGSLGSAQVIPSEEKNRYLISSIMEEAIASSQLEGAATTRKVAKEMLKSARKPRNKSEKMIVNNYLTAKMIKDSKIKKLTPEFILEIHKNIVKDTLEDSTFEGKFRDSNDIMVVDNVTGDISYHPPSYKSVPKLIQEVCNFVNNPSQYYIHPIVKASILHFLIGYIHPFVDGNGRTARSLFYWYLSKEGYWVIEFMSISRVIIKSPVGYARAYLYTETDENDLTYFINYQLKTMDIALRELRSYISRKIKEKNHLFKIIENIEHINIRQVSILREFLDDEKTILTIKEVQEMYNVVYQTARNDLLELEKAGFLRHQIRGNKKLIFLRSKDFDKLIEQKIGQKYS